MRDTIKSGECDHGRPHMGWIRCRFVGPQERKLSSDALMEKLRATAFTGELTVTFQAGKISKWELKEEGSA